MLQAIRGKKWEMSLYRSIWFFACNIDISNYFILNKKYKIESLPHLSSSYDQLHDNITLSKYIHVYSSFVTSSYKLCSSIPSSLSNLLSFSILAPTSSWLVHKLKGMYFFSTSLSCYGHFYVIDSHV